MILQEDALDLRNWVFATLAEVPEIDELIYKGATTEALAKCREALTRFLRQHGGRHPIGHDAVIDARRALKAADEVFGEESNLKCPCSACAIERKRQARTERVKAETQ
jgi:hypothetical protein